VTIDNIIAAIDEEISRLTKARDALTGAREIRTRSRRGGGRAWSPAARARQARMMKARWAAKKKTKP